VRGVADKTPVRSKCSQCHLPGLAMAIVRGWTAGLSDRAPTSSAHAMTQRTVPLRAMFKRLKSEGFFLGMAIAVGLAIAAPSIGAPGGALHLEIATPAAIALMFLLHGLALSPRMLKAGASNWRLHVFIQLCTFAVFPVLGLMIASLLGPRLAPELVLGVLYLCTLPSTISSSVAMTGAAGGNVPAAIFNATLSSVLGVILTPLLVVSVANAHGQGVPFAQALIGVALQLVVPFAAGQALRPLGARLVARYANAIHVLDRGVVLVIVYTSFCVSTKAGLWSDYAWQTFASAAALVALLLGVVIALTTWGARRLGLCREDEIAAVFCGSKKSLATGAPIANLLFAGQPGIGMIVLPIMLYHQLQLIVCSIIARRYARG